MRARKMVQWCLLGPMTLPVVKEDLSSHPWPWLHQLYNYFSFWFKLWSHVYSLVASQFHINAFRLSFLVTTAFLWNDLPPESTLSVLKCRSSLLVDFLFYLPHVTTNCFTFLFIHHARGVYLKDCVCTILPLWQVCSSSNTVCHTAWTSRALWRALFGTRKSIWE